MPRKLSEGLVLHQNFWRLWTHNKVGFLSSGFLGMTITASETDPTDRALLLLKTKKLINTDLAPSLPLTFSSFWTRSLLRRHKLKPAHVFQATATRQAID